MDTPLRQIAEIDLFEKGYLVTSPAWDMLSKLHGNNLHEGNLKKLPGVERQKLRSTLSDKIGRCSYGVLAKKLVHKETVEKHFK